MIRYHAHGFVDGGYLRCRSRELKLPWVDPSMLLHAVVYRSHVQEWGRAPHVVSSPIALTRVAYYDALPDDGGTDPDDLRGYLRCVERLPDTELGFGLLRGRHRRQKGVDTQLSVDMVVGAFTGAFQVAVLVAGDADFIPAVQEVKRRGVLVVVAACESSLSEDLVAAADRFVPIATGRDGFFPALQHKGTWPKT